MILLWSNAFHLLTLHHIQIPYGEGVVICYWVIIWQWIIKTVYYDLFYLSSMTCLLLLLFQRTKHTSTLHLKLIKCVLSIVYYEDKYGI